MRFANGCTPAVFGCRETAYEDIKLLSVVVGYGIETEPLSNSPPPARRAQGENCRLTRWPASANNCRSSPPLSVSSKLGATPSSHRLMLALDVRHPIPRLPRKKVARTAWNGRWSPGLCVLGEIEALESLASYSFERPDDFVPREFLGGTRLPSLAKGLGHPLIASRNARSANGRSTFSGPDTCAHGERIEHVGAKEHPAALGRHQHGFWRWPEHPYAPHACGSPRFKSEPAIRVNEPRYMRAVRAFYAENHPAASTVRSHRRCRCCFYLD